MKTITGGNLPRIPDRDKSCVRADQCRLLGRCVCSSEGKELSAFCTKFASFLKMQVCRRPEDKALLMSGHLVVALCPIDALAGGRAAAADLEHPIFEQEHDTVWLHIGLQYLSPFRPTFQAMVPSSASAVVDGGVSLRATGTFSAWHNQFADFELGQLYWASLFRLWEGEVPIAEVVPAEVCVHRFRKPALFWLGSLRRTRASQLVAARSGGDSHDVDDEALPALEDGQDEGDASGGEELLEEGDQVQDAEINPNENLETLLAGLFAEVVDAPPEVMPEGFAPEAPADTAAKEADKSDGLEESLAAEGANRPASSNDPPPEVPPPAAPAPAAESAGLRGVRRVAEVAGYADRPRGAGLYCTAFAGGSITFYPDKDAADKGRFQAVCGNIAEHGNRCRLTRTKHEPKNADRTPAQGRPLGLLAAWLELSHAPNVDTSADHLANACLINTAARQAARGRLMMQESGALLAACERARREGEDDEPALLP